MKPFQIAIDGPAGSGKSTIARRIANILKITYLDTGAMYRACAYYFQNNNIDFMDNFEESKINLKFKNGKIHLNNINISKEIRKLEISKITPLVAQNKQVREYLTKLQRNIANSENIIMDGRDIGSNVLKEANIKIYLDASSYVRAKRRFNDKTSNVTLKELEQEIIKRDNEDKNRELNPLIKSKDAIEIDTSYLSIGEVTNQILALVRRNTCYQKLQ